MRAYRAINATEIEHVWLPQKNGLWSGPQRFAR